MATNLNITTNSTSVSSNNFSVTVTDNNTGNVVNISPPTSPIVSISAAGILGNPGKDSDVIAGESVIFQHITASGEISASGIVYGSQINIGGGIFTSASLAAAEASGDNLGNHTATQNLNLDGNSLLDGLNITASGGIRANNVDVGDVSGISSIYDLRVGGGGIRTSGTGYFYGISNPSTYTGAGRITLSGENAYIQTPSYVSASRAILNQITASGNISSSGEVYAQQYFIKNRSILDYSTSGEILRLGYNNDTNTIEIGRTGVTTQLTLNAPVTASGNISSSGNIISSNIVLPESSNSTLTLFSSHTDSTAFLLNGRSNMNSYLSVLSGQKLGIGLAVDETPSSKLTISGDLKVSSHLTASGNISASGNLNVANITTPGTLTVGHLEATTINTLQLTSSIVTSSVIFSSGSNIFGDEISDTHIFNGHITASGNISASNLITATSGAFSYIQGNSPLTINPDQLIVTPNDYFQVLTGGTTSSIFISQSSGNIGFNTNNPQTGFDVIVTEAQFQQPGARKGLKINDEGNIESFSKDAITAATGSEFVLRYSRGVSITKNSLSALNIDVIDDTSATQYFNSLQPKDQNVILEKLEILGFITPPQVGDVLGSIRFLAESGSSVVGEGYDDRSTGETAAIKAVVSDGASDGISSDLIFSVANKAGAAQQKLLLDSNDSHQLTGSLNIFGGLTISGQVRASSNTNTYIDFINSDNDIRFLNNNVQTLSSTPSVFIINPTNANVDFRVDGDTNDNLIFVDAGTEKVGIGIGTPTEKLQVEGNISASGEFIGASANITNITASGNISASALIEGIGFRASGNSGFGGKLHVGGTTVNDFDTGQIFKATGTSEFTSHITASGNISASGDVYGLSNYVGNKIFVDYVPGVSTFRIAGGGQKTQFYGPIVGAENLLVNTHITASGNISASGDLMVNNINGTINGGTF